jgi:large subunit ribosomal protein L4
MLLRGSTAMLRRCASSMLRPALQTDCRGSIGAMRAITSSSAPQESRRPFQQRNRRRDDALVPRALPGVPEVTSPFLQAWLSSWSEPRAGIAQLRSDIWAMPLRTDIVHRVVTWQRACARQGTSKTKSRHEVRGGGKKPRPQKGSGRSRQGSIRSPIWVGGGHAHPKRPRDFSYKLNVKVVTLGMKTALSDKYRRGALVVLRDLDLGGSTAEVLEQKLADIGFDLDRQRGARKPAHSPPNPRTRLVPQPLKPQRMVARVVCKFVVHGHPCT